MSRRLRVVAICPGVHPVLVLFIRVVEVPRLACACAGRRRELGFPAHLDESPQQAEEVVGYLYGIIVKVARCQDFHLADVHPLLLFYRFVVGSAAMQASVVAAAASAAAAAVSLLPLLPPLQLLLSLGLRCGSGGGRDGGCWRGGCWRLAAAGICVQ